MVSGKVIGAIALGLVGARAVDGHQRSRDAAAARDRRRARCWASSSPTSTSTSAAYERSQRIQRDLADAIDLMTISVESGLGFDAAVQQVARNTDGPLAEEFSRMLREMQIGQGRGEALRGLGERTDVADLKSFTGAMVQADVLGIPVATVLRVQSKEMRIKRRQLAETKAQQVPVKITVPLIFCILPCLFMAVMGPAVLTVLDSFG